MRLVLLLEHFAIGIEQSVHVKLGLEILEAVESERFAGLDEKTILLNREQTLVRR